MSGQFCTSAMFPQSGTLYFRSSEVWQRGVLQTCRLQCRMLGALSPASSAALDQQCSTALRQERAFKNICSDDVDILTYHPLITFLTLLSPQSSLQKYNQFSQQQTSVLYCSEKTSCSKKCLLWTKTVQGRNSGAVLTWLRSFCPTWMSLPSFCWLSRESVAPFRF